MKKQIIVLSIVLYTSIGFGGLFQSKPPPKPKNPPLFNIEQQVKHEQVHFDFGKKPK